MDSKDRTMELQGSVWLTVDGEKFGGEQRIALLAKIAECGSITQAAKAIKMSYKAAWDAIDAMSNLAGEPLMQRAAALVAGNYPRVLGEEAGKRMVSWGELTPYACGGTHVLSTGEIGDIVIGKVKEKGYALITLKLYFTHGLVKMELALATGKKLYDKRQSMAEKDAKREMDRTLKERNR